MSTDQNKEVVILWLDMLQLARDILLYVIILLSLASSFPIIDFSIGWIQSIRIVEPSLSTGAILLWAEELETSLEQIGEFYQWCIFVVRTEPLKDLRCISS